MIGGAAYGQNKGRSGCSGLCLFRLQVFVDLVARVSSRVTAVLMILRWLLMILLGRARSVRVVGVSVCIVGAIRALIVRGRVLAVR